jgi:hypothetical protein
LRVLNIRCGDDLRGRIRGDYLSYVDPLCQGPVAGMAGRPAFIERRARFIAANYGVPFPAARTRLQSELAGLARAADYDRVVLWFEHDIYDQAILAFLLDWFARHRLAPGVLRIVQAATHLGTMDGRALARQESRAVTPELLARGRDAWRAYAAATPAILQRIADDDIPAPPLFADAAFRHLQEFPWTRDGLSLTQRLALHAVAEGATTAGEAFVRVQQAEPQPFLGGTMFFAILRDLHFAPHPALSGDATLTEFGEALLAGGADWVAENGIDRWLGGVHLRGPEARWRWDDGEAGLVELYKAP